jgi:photosystem II stability/assembly factor-like uncharacterized protein
MKKPKTTLIFVFYLVSCILILLSNQLSAQWQWQNDIIFIDENNGWASGDCGTIIRTYDGGYTWETQFNKRCVSFPSICFTDQLFGWVLGVQDTIFRSTDGGDNWEAFSTGLFWNIEITDIYFTDTDLGWAVGDLSTIIHTSDGGETWETQYGGSGTSLLTSVYFTDAQNGWAAGPKELLHTSDGGNTWEIQSDTLSLDYGDVFFTDANYGWVIRLSYFGHFPPPPISSIMNTIDGGNTWETQYSVYGNMLSEIFFLNRDTGWIVGNDMGYLTGGWGRNIFHTVDGGITWETQASGTNNGLSGVYFTDENNGWVVGANGTILHTDNGGMAEIPKFEFPNSNPLLKIYPNPFLNQTNIEFTLPKSEFVTLSIYDITGKHLKTILSKKLSKGNHKINWNAESLNEGIYFIRLETNPAHAGQIVKMIKL